MLTILGGGPAGLAVGYYARKRALPFRILEAGDEVGGNCRTIERGPFRFDTGAHRFHDKDPESTAEVRALLGDDLLAFDAPSQILYQGTFVDFPLSPMTVMQALGPWNSLVASIEFVLARLQRTGPFPSFEEMAFHQYGRTIATDFLLGYSRKLWGVSTRKLVSEVGGGRLTGLELWTLLGRALPGMAREANHQDGVFYYPRRGIGVIPRRLAEACGAERITTRSRITRVIHRDDRIAEIEVNDRERHSVDRVVSTLPLGALIQLLEPKAPEPILERARSLRFRHLVLVVLFLNRESVTRNASLYFPDPGTPFTRVYEPKNRSAWMSPEHQTSLCIEIPCDMEDPLWAADGEALAALALGHLERYGLVRHEEVLESSVHRMRFAYPVIEMDSAAAAAELLEYLVRFANLRSVGRNGTFTYSSLHDMLRTGRKLVEQLQKE